MSTNKFSMNGLITLSQTNEGNELDRYCKMEGMDCQHLLSESHSIKSLFGKKKYPKMDSDHSSRAN